MATSLRSLKLDRIDLVDVPANPGARVVLLKRDDLCPGCAECADIDKRIRHRNGKWEVTNEEGTKILGTHDSKQEAQRQLAAVEANKPHHKDAPGIGSVHVNSPDLRSRKRRSDRMSKKFTLAGISKAFQRILKEAEAEAEGAAPGSDEHENEEMGHINALQEMHRKMGEAMKGLPADHPMHAMHKELGDHIGNMHKEAEARMPKEGEAAHHDEEMGPDVRKRFDAINKTVKDLTDQLTAAKTQTSNAEAIAKREADARATGEIVAVLKGFKHLTLDIDKQAPILKSLRDTNQQLYDDMLTTLKAANNQAEVAKALERSVGSNNGQVSEGSAWAEICAEADKIVAKNANITTAKARNMIMETRFDLVKRYYAEGGANDPVAGVQ